MNRILTTLFALCLAMAASAQKVTVSGIVVDSDGSPMPGATVVIMNPDSTQVTGQQTKSDGSFSISSVKVGTYLLRASFIGYRTSWRKLELTKKYKAMLLGEIVLEDDAKILKEAQVTARAAQVEMKADTFV